MDFFKIYHIFIPRSRAAVSASRASSAGGAESWYYTMDKEVCYGRFHVPLRRGGLHQYPVQAAGRGGRKFRLLLFICRTSSGFLCPSSPAARRRTVGWMSLPGAGAVPAACGRCRAVMSASPRVWQAPAVPEAPVPRASRHGHAFCPAAGFSRAGAAPLSAPAPVWP